MNDLSQHMQLRPAKESDIDFIIDSWLRSYRRCADNVRDTEYYRGHRDAISKGIEENRITLAVMCSTQAPDIIVGWIAAANGVLHYVYVKAAFRRQGVCASMLKTAEVDRYSHLTPQWVRWMRRQSWHGRYDPYRFYL